jgi:hypothetical protein
MDQTPSQEPEPNQGQPTIASASQNVSGPFIEVDDSSEDEEETSETQENPPRRSVTRLIKRPRHDTTAKLRHNDIFEQSRAMRAKARERAQEDLAIRSNTAAPGSSNADLDVPEAQAFLGLPHRRRML